MNAKKLLEKEIKELIQLNIELRENIEDYVTSYVDWVERNVPEGLKEVFGVGVVLDCRHGTYWGFENTEYEYVHAGRSWYVANDFDCRIQGSSCNEVIIFSKKIPSLIEKGLEAIKVENEDIEKVLRNKVEFKD